MNPLTSENPQLYCLFEFRLYDGKCTEDDMLLDSSNCVGPNYSSLKLEWTRVVDRISLLEMHSDGKFAFYGGTYSIQVRSIDPAGNVDSKFIEGENQHTWIYYPKLPVGLIMACVLSFMAICSVIFLEVRRRKRKRAMERYAMKRMRRKFKGMQKNAAKQEKRAQAKSKKRAMKK